MSAELARVPDADVEPVAAPVAVPPPHVVAAIAYAAVEAYKTQERARKAALHRTWYAANREHVLQQQADRRAAQRAHPTR